MPSSRCRRWRVVRWLGGLVFVLSLGSSAWSPAAAVELSDILTGYTLTSWTQRDGLPFGAVRGTAQDDAGFLWLATDYGVVRFDGSHFETWEELGGTPLPYPQVRSVVRSRDDTLWVGLDKGGVCHLTQMRRSAQCDAPSSGVPDEGVVALLEDDAGTLWAGARDGLFTRTPGGWRKVRADVIPRVLSLAKAGQRLLVGATSGLFEHELGSQTWHHVPGVAVPRDVAASPGGDIYVTDFTRGFRKLGETGGAQSKAVGRGATLFFDSSGNFWVGTLGQGLWRIDAVTRRVEYATALTGLPSDGVLSIMEDRDGNLWTGTPEGLTRLARQVAKQITGLGLVRAVLRQADGIWVAATDVLYEYGDADITHARATVSLDGATFRAISRTREGIVLVATNAGLSRLEKGRLLPVPGTDRMHDITWIAGDLQSDVWLFDEREGLWRLRGERLFQPESPALRNVTVTAAHEDDEGRVWVALDSGRLVMLSADREPLVFEQASGLPKGPFLAIANDPSSGIWVAGDGAIARLQGEQVATIAFGSPLLQRASSIVVDRDGALWLATGSGVFKVTRADYERSLKTGAEPLYTRFDRWDGLAGLPSATYGDTGRAALAPNGALWFVTGRGVSVIDPALLDEETAAVVPSIYSVTLDGAESQAPTEKLTVPSRVRKLMIRYTAIDLSPSKRRFRHRLEGFEDAWTEGAVERAAQYTNLSPGSYRFRVQVSDAKGVWGSETSLELSVRPPFYQSTAFLIWCAVGLLAALGLAWLVQLRRVHASYAIAVAERARMGREIHDTLLQGLVGVALQLDAMASDLDDRPLVHQLVRLQQRIEGYIRDARLSILNLRSAGWNDSLARLVRKEAEASRGVSPIEFTVSGEPYPCPQLVCDELLKVCREAVVNASKHSDASQIRVTLTYQPGSISLMVADDGHGFDPDSVSAAAHYGLIGMQERAELLGGRFELISLPGAGTCIEVVIPTRRMRIRQWFKREKLTLAET